MKTLDMLRGAVELYKFCVSRVLSLSICIELERGFFFFWLALW